MALTKAKLVAAFLRVVVFGVVIVAVAVAVAVVVVVEVISCCSVALSVISMASWQYVDIELRLVFVQFGFVESSVAGSLSSVHFT